MSTLRAPPGFEGMMFVPLSVSRQSDGWEMKFIANDFNNFIGRKASCDLAPVTCGSCIRARVIRTGYRDTEKLRIRDETDSLHRKAAAVRRRANGSSDRGESLLLELRAANTEPRYLPVALDVQAKELFFDHYILAVYLSHQFGSQKARLTALERYTRALGVMNKVLESPETSKEMTTLFTTLLLDLFEKLSTTQPPGNRGWSNHLREALAIFQVYGDQFTTSSNAMRAFTRLSTNLLITSLAAGTALPSGFFRLREY
ncbi:uncharacterized protein EAF01_001317 [Botrytis porri]|uniref:uncharacterized protein n=1 Tax=Botrytis porri TaxID=87229 RepID=UPI0019004ABF|nr:uncharacterized protein EAF01_001317 [Botrytis porri]KAF7912296.1 hypothetical protein EAF01_001317 [Botrytis porri]